MTVIDNTIQAEGLGDFFKNLGKKVLNISKSMAKNVLKKPSRALEICAYVATAAASRIPKNVLSTLSEVIKFYHKGRGVNLGKTQLCYKKGPKM